MIKGETKTLLLMRHGFTQWNLDNRYNSRTDISLVPGENPNLDLHTSLIDKFGVKRIVSSPAKRAIETVKLVREVWDFFPVHWDVWPELRETDFGDFEGKTKVELKNSNFAAQYDDWMNSHTTEATPPNGEDWESVLARANETFKRVQSLDEDLILVSHGYFIRCLVSLALDVHPPQGVRKVTTENYCLFRLEFNSGSKPKLASPVFI